VYDAEARRLLHLVVYPPARIGTVAAEAWRAVRREPRAALRALGRGLADMAAALPTPVLAVKQAAMLPLALAYARHLPAGGCRLHAHFASLPTAVVRVLAALRATAYSFTAHAWDIYVPENRRLLPARIAAADLSSPARPTTARSSPRSRPRRLIGRRSRSVTTASTCRSMSPGGSGARI
jgi:hypothetical protein